MKDSFDKYKDRMKKIRNGMRDCESCFELAYLNEEGECVPCQIKMLKNGPRLPKEPVTRKELKEFEALKFLANMLIGKSKE